MKMKRRIIRVILGSIFKLFIISLLEVVMLTLPVLSFLWMDNNPYLSFGAIFVWFFLFCFVVLDWKKFGEIWGR